MAKQIKDILQSARDITEGVNTVKKNMDGKTFTGVSDTNRHISITLDGQHRVHQVTVAPNALKDTPEQLAQHIQTALEEVMMQLEHAERDAFNGMMQSLDLYKYASESKEDE
jgi:DNA-binding protein YbaB